MLLTALLLIVIASTYNCAIAEKESINSSEEGIAYENELRNFSDDAPTETISQEEFDKTGWLDEYRADVKRKFHPWAGKRGADEAIQALLLRQRNEELKALASKRGSSAFQPWAGKRSALGGEETTDWSAKRRAFSPWAGKRQAPFSPWAGKRSFFPVSAGRLDTLGGKRKTPFNPWAGKRSSFARSDKLRK